MPEQALGGIPFRFGDGLYSIEDIYYIYIPFDNNYYACMQYKPNSNNEIHINNWSKHLITTMQFITSFSLFSILHEYLAILCYCMYIGRPWLFVEIVSVHVCTVEVSHLAISECVYSPPMPNFKSADWAIHCAVHSYIAVLLLSEFNFWRVINLYLQVDLTTPNWPGCPKVQASVQVMCQACPQLIKV